MKPNTNPNHDRNIITLSVEQNLNFISKYFPAAFISIWILVLITEVIFNFDLRSWDGKIHLPTLTIFLISPFFLVSGSFYFFIASRFAHRIIFNFTEGNVQFHMLFKRKPIEHLISDIKIVNLTWHMYFKFKKGRTIWYAGNGEMFQFLSKKNIPRRWGKVFRRMNKKHFEADVTYKEPAS